MNGIERDDDTTVVFELQGSLFFGTANQLQSALEPETEKRKYVILSMRRVQSLDVTATHVLEQIKDRLEANNAYLVFCDIPKGLPSGLKMKRFLKDTGVVRPTNKAFAFRELDEALEWVDAREMEAAAVQVVSETPMEVRDMPILAGRSEETIKALEALLELRSIKAGKKIFKTETAGDELFFIRRGSVKVMIPIRKKEQYHLATCGSGEIIGGVGFLDSSIQGSIAIAITDTEVYALSRASFDALAEQHRVLALSIIEHVALSLSTRLRVAIGEIQALRG